MQTIVLDRGLKKQASTTDEGWIRPIDVPEHPEVRRDERDFLREAAVHLEENNSDVDGDTALLGAALGFLDGEHYDEIIVLTDDKPLRKTCKALGVPISGSIGVVIAAVERGDLDPDEAKDTLVAMDEVGARLSARSLRKAERLIADAAEVVEE